MKNCYRCGKIATTRDHIPPKNLFEKPLPNNLITVPACKKCNNRFSYDEEWFRNHILAISFSERGRKLWKEKAVKALKRRPALKLEMIKNIKKISNGTSIIEFDKKRANKVIKKIVNGLFFHHFKQRIKKGFRWTIDFNPKDNLLLTKGKYARFFNIQDDSFRYAFATAKEDNNYSLWWLLFHNNALFVIGITK